MGVTDTDSLQESRELDAEEQRIRGKWDAFSHSRDERFMEGLSKEDRLRCALGGEVAGAVKEYLHKLEPRPTDITKLVSADFWSKEYVEIKLSRGEDYETLKTKVKELGQQLAPHAKRLDVQMQISSGHIELGGDPKNIFEVINEGWLKPNGVTPMDYEQVSRRAQYHVSRSVDEAARA